MDYLNTTEIISAAKVHLSTCYTHLEKFRVPLQSSEMETLADQDNQLDQLQKILQGIGKANYAFKMTKKQNRVAK